MVLMTSTILLCIESAIVMHSIHSVTIITNFTPIASNPDLTWEKTTTYNGGLDFTALNGRFGFNVDGYYRKTTDLLATVAIAGGTNFGDQLLKNIGSVENYGVELAFNVKPIVTRTSCGM